jgi:isopenicillin N synthase-like dioxygenase
VKLDFKKIYTLKGIMKTSEIPILDCSNIAGPYYKGLESTQGFKEFMKDLCDGMSGIGFVYLINHGVDPAIVI